MNITYSVIIKPFSFHDVTMFVFLHEGFLINIVHFKKKINHLAFQNLIFVYSGAFYIVPTKSCFIGGVGTSNVDQEIHCV